MRAVVVGETGGPERLVVSEIETPSPGPGEVSIDVVHAGVGFVDTLFRAGAFPLALPFVPGLEAGGTVRALGEGVSGLEVGQRVAALLNDFGRGPRSGGYAEVAVAHASCVVAVPDSADLATVTGALVNGVTGWLALHELARLSPDDRVLVLGAGGGLGSTTSRLAALSGATVTGVVSRDPSRAPAECAEVVLTADLEAWLAEHAPDVVVDPVGGRARELAVGALAPFGRLVVLGNASGEDVALSSDLLWHETVVVTGLSLGGVAHLWSDHVQTALRAVVGLLDRGLLREPRPAVRPLAEAADVHRALEAREAPAKTVLEL